MAINFNTGPYYDDFDVDKNFYKVLYKPGYAVQARELNQMQSIQQDQTAAMANHLFRKNSMVIPGGISLNNQADIVFFGSSETVSDLSTLVGKTITNAPSFDYTDDSTLDGYITAVVLGYKESNATTGVPGALYVRYVKTSTSDDRTTFDTSEALQTVEATPAAFTTDADYESGYGKIATLSSGIFYTTDLFVSTGDQSIIVETDSTLTTNCSIGLNIVESIVTSDEDESLLDNANGAPNQYAPGADRYKVELQLVRVDSLENVDLDRFITMMTIENNVVTYINDRTQYSEIMKMIARRTYDANGNFVVEGLKPFVNESGDDEYVVANITNGRCYVGGYEYDQLTDEPILIRKPRADVNTQTISNVSKFATGLTEFFVAGGDLLFELPTENSLVQFLNASPRKVTFAAADADTGAETIAITDHKFVSGNQVIYDNGGGTTIGGLTDGNTYYVIRVNANSIKLTATYADAIAGTNPVNLSSGGAGSAHTLEKVADIVGTGVFKSIQYFSGSPGADGDDIYKAYFDWVILNEGYTVDDFGGFRVVSPTPSNQGGSILHEVRVKTQTGLFSIGDTVISTTLADVRATVYDVVNVSILYLIKDSTYDVPTTEVIANQTVSGVTAVVRSVYVSNYTDGSIPMIKVDNSTIKHISNMQYSVIRRYVFEPTSGDRVGSWDLTADGETYENFSPAEFYAYNVTQKTFIDLAGISEVTNGGDTFVIDLDLNSDYDGDTIWVYTTVNKTIATAIPKTPTEVTIEIKDPSRTFTALGHAGVTSIVKVVDGGKAAVTFDATDDKVVLEGHGLSNNQIVYFSSITTTTGISTNTPYYVINRTDDDFEVSSSSGGSKLGLTNDGTGVMLPPPNINTGVDITSRFFLSSEDYAYVSGTSLIKLRKNMASPIGRIAVKYEYFAYSDTGDFASVDSYGDWDNTDGIGGEADLRYIGTIPNTTTARQDVIQTRKYLDFRTRTSNYFFKNRGTIYSGEDTLTLKDINLTYLADSLIGSYLVGPGYQDSIEITDVALDTNGNTVLTLDAAADANYTGIYFVGLQLDGSSLSIADATAGAQTFAFPKSDTQMTYSYIKFLPKNVMVYVNRSKDQLTVEHTEVENFIEAYNFRRNDSKLPLSYIEMEPYCIDMNEVRVYNFQNPVYKMLDIHDLKLRIDRVEYYASLGLDQDLEQAITDAQNENADESRYGLWNENFMDMTTQEFDSPDYSCTIYERTFVSPSVVTRTINLEIDNANSPSTWQRTGSAITLPYIETVALQNPFASEFVNLNPFNVLFYQGKMTLNPPVDNWIDVTTSPTVSVATTNTVNNPVVTANPKIIIVDPPGTVVQPPPILPPPPAEEIIVEITNLRTSWGPDTAGGRHAITFDWRTNFGRVGRVNTDWHLSSVLKNMGAKTSSTAKAGYDGTYARSLINRRYNDTGVKEYLNAGTHFDQKPPNKW